ncbi:MAG TPA: hypothetical protein VGI10_30350 [Polyangiaceae bacterium]|jgi:hypothetical protein
MLAIPFGKRAKPEPASALARVESEATRKPELLAVRRSKYIDAHPDVALSLLAQRSGDAACLLAWLKGDNQLALPAQGGTIRARAHLLVSDRYAAIVAYTRAGERLYAELEPNAEATLVAGERLTLNAGNLGFTVSGRSVRRAAQVVGLLRLGALERVLEAARLHWLAGGRSRATHATALLALARRQGSVRARFVGFLAAPETIESAELARALESERVSPDTLAELWETWSFSSESAAALVAALARLGEHALPWALALHDRAREPAAVGLEQACSDLLLAGAHAERALATAPDDARLRALLATLAVGGLKQLEQSAPSSPVATLSDQQIREQLAHPATRGIRLDFWRAPALLAHVGKKNQVEDLSDYCEPLLSSNHAAATRAVAAACRALGLPPLPAYVSRGKKSLGVRSQRGSPASLLIGIDHLTEDSAYAMSERELWSAIGAECAYLRLGHGRVTRRDLWTGALAHTRDGLELALGLLPVLRGARLGMRLGSALERVPEPALRRALAFLAGVDLARPFPASGPRALALSHFNEELLSAHRITQLSADRAGLLLSGDLRATLRALLLVRPDYRALLNELESAELPRDLLARPASPMLADLIVRSAALLTFYLSDDYVALRRALGV